MCNPTKEETPDLLMRFAKIKLSQVGGLRMLLSSIFFLRFIVFMCIALLGTTMKQKKTCSKMKTDKKK